jgi:photosystem II stability/assembly factor-like uncharacterized protein
MKKLFLYGILFFCTHHLAAQPGPDATLKQLLQNKTRLADIMKVVNGYYKNPATISRKGSSAANSEYKRWNRWAYYWESRLDANGKFVNAARRMVQATGMQPRTARADAPAAVTGSWTIVGPLNTPSGIGRADRLAFDPTDPNVIYAGTTAGGLWRTLSGGLSWANLTPDIPVPGISGIVVNPQNPNIIYILTGDGDSDFGGLVESYGYIRYSMGVLKSTDGGANWRKTADFPGVDSFLTGFNLVADPNNPNLLYAATSQGLFRTTNGGNSWEMRSIRLTYDIAFRPGSSDTIYKTDVHDGRTRFGRSTNGGDFFLEDAAINSQIDSATRCKLAVAPSSASIVYLMAGGPVWQADTVVPGTFTGLYRSVNNGSSFTLMSNTPNISSSPSTGSRDLSTYNWSLAVRPTLSSRLATGAVSVYTSSNSGTTLTPSAGGIHADVHELRYNPLNNRLWAACDGGVYYSDNDGVNWSDSYFNMSITQFYHMDVSPFDHQDMLGGTQDNGVKRRTGITNNFDDISGNDGFQVYYHPDSTNVYYSVQNKTIHRSRNSGASWPNITPTANNDFFPNLVRHPTNGQILIAANVDTTWRSTNGGSSWTTFAGIFGKHAMCYGISNTNRVYIAGRNDGGNPAMLRRSDNGGVSWPFILNNGTDFPVTTQRLTCIGVNPANSGNVWITFGGFSNGIKVFYSPDAGVTWFNRSGSIPNVPVNCVAVDGNNNAYLGTDNGVYYRGASMSDWIPFYNNLPYVPVTDLIITEAESRIRAATFGRGIWQSETRTACADSIHIAGTLEGQEFYETSNSITASATLKVSEGTKVQMRGGTEVHLLPGFTAGDTTQFRALIGPCGSGSGVAGFRTGGGMQHIMPRGNFTATLEIKPGGAALEAVVDMRINGNASFELTDLKGTVLQTWPAATLLKGHHVKLFTTPALKPGLYYLQVYVNGAWAHLQEWEVK